MNIINDYAYKTIQANQIADEISEITGLDPSNILDLAKEMRDENIDIIQSLKMLKRLAINRQGMQLE